MQATKTINGSTYKAPQFYSTFLQSAYQSSTLNQSRIKNEKYTQELEVGSYCPTFRSSIDPQTEPQSTLNTEREHIARENYPNQSIILNSNFIQNQAIILTDSVTISNVTTISKEDGDTFNFRLNILRSKTHEHGMKCEDEKIALHNTIAELRDDLQEARSQFNQLLSNNQTLKSAIKTHQDRSIELEKKIEEQSRELFGLSQVSENKINHNNSIQPCEHDFSCETHNHYACKQCTEEFQTKENELKKIIEELKVCLEEEIKKKELLKEEIATLNKSIIEENVKKQLLFTSEDELRKTIEELKNSCRKEIEKQDCLKKKIEKLRVSNSEGAKKQNQLQEENERLRKLIVENSKNEIDKVTELETALQHFRSELSQYKRSVGPNEAINSKESISVEKEEEETKLRESKTSKPNKTAETPKNIETLEDSPKTLKLQESRSGIRKETRKITQTSSANSKASSSIQTLENKESSLS